MIQPHHLLRLSAIPFLAHALNLPSLQSINVTSTTTPLIPTNKTLLIPKYSCIGGPIYGDSIPLSSCRDAANELLSSLPYSHRDRLSFGDWRSASRTEVNVPLPYISISSDGACALEIVTEEPLLSDFATILQFTEWADNMINLCETDENVVKGGVAANLGAYQNLGLKLSKFSSGNIACKRTSAPVTADCEFLLDKMPATDLWRGFGSHGGRGVDVHLPFEIWEPGRRCAITVKTNGPPDHEKWYTIWKQAAAVVKLCVSDRGSGGAAHALGLERKKIYVEVSDGPPSAEE